MKLRIAAALAFTLATTQIGSAQEAGIELLTPEEARAQNCSVPENMAYAIPHIAAQRDIYTPQFNRIATFANIQDFFMTMQKLQSNGELLEDIHRNARQTDNLFSECQAMKAVIDTRAPALVFQPSSLGEEIKARIIGADSIPTPN